MKFERLLLKRSEFDKLAPPEQCLFVLCCHLMHRIHILSNMFLATKVTGGGYEDTAAGCQQSLFMKIHAGFLFEAWKSLKKLYFDTDLSAKYAPRLSKRGRDAAESLLRYYKKHSAIGQIRVKFGFHTDLELLKKGIEIFDRSADIELLVEPNQRAPFFCAVAEYMTSASLIDGLGVEDSEAFGRWVTNELAQTATGGLLDLSSELCAIIAKECKATWESDVDIRVASKDDLNLPYFADMLEQMET